ncbi:MAG TPA: RNA-binding cell elongation regulator Jag/EloR [Acidimicrobiales bacterium]|nr:RNA-binding cell elongation regulator Jag/EloR [Acidimicrobiales bacterium]
MEWVEASGKSLGEARESALDLLGVAEDDAEFVVLSEPKAGLFGRLRGEARVQARVRPVTPPPKRGRRQRPERKRSGGEGAGPSSGDRSDRRNGSSDDGRPATQTKPGGSQARNRSGSRRGKSETSNGSGPNRLSRDGAAVSNGASPAGAGQSVEQPSGREPEEKEGIVEESLTIGQQGEAAKDFMAGLIREFGLQADIDVRELDEETVEVAASGDNLGLLVGPRGATLSAVQDLTRTFVQRQSESRTDRILVDVGGYREKRSAALRRFTEGIVAEVKESGSERALEPMNAADRKVVHDAVNEVEGVQTRSEGDDPARYVVIEPIS